MSYQIENFSDTHNWEYFIDLYKKSDTTSLVLPNILVPNSPINSQSDYAPNLTIYDLPLDHVNHDDKTFTPPHIPRVSSRVRHQPSHLKIMYVLLFMTPQINLLHILLTLIPILYLISIYLFINIVLVFQ